MNTRDILLAFYAYAIIAIIVIGRRWQAGANGWCIAAIIQPKSQVDASGQPGRGVHLWN